MNLYFESNEIVTNFEGPIKVTLAKKELPQENYLYIFEIDDKVVFRTGVSIFNIESRLDMIFYIKKVERLLGYSPESFSPELIESIITGKTDFFTFCDGMDNSIVEAHKSLMPGVVRISDTELAINDFNTINLVSVEDMKEKTD